MGGVKLPERLKVYVRPPIKISNEIDGSRISRTVRPAMFVDAAGKTSGAESWYKAAYNNSCQYGTTVGGQEDKRDIIEIPNAPFTDVRLWTIEDRSEGGCAWKVFWYCQQLGCNLFFDMRTDIVLDSMLVGDVTGPYFTGQYVWVRNYSQMRVCRLGDRYYQEGKEAVERKDSKKIPTKDLRPGGIYVTRGGEEFLYLGRVRTSKDKLGFLVDPHFWWSDSKGEGPIIRLACDFAENTNLWRIYTSHSFVSKCGQISEDLVERAYMIANEKEERLWKKVL